MYVWLVEEIVDGTEDEKEQDMPFIRPSSTSQHSSLRFDEVQQAVQGAAAISQSHTAEGSQMLLLSFVRSCSSCACSFCFADVNNPDFLSKLQSQPELLQGLANPRYTTQRHKQPLPTTHPSQHINALIAAAFAVLVLIAWQSECSHR